MVKWWFPGDGGDKKDVVLSNVVSNTFQLKKTLCLTQLASMLLETSFKNNELSKMFPL